ncbi:MAG: DUF1987 domain-containing protein [Rhodobacterales bacterium]|nr:DUF1987 domain-containing protein [Rhodobacterales bacterium]
MDTVKIQGSERTPEVDFDFGSNVFVLSGESYPEDVTAFFGPIIEKLEAHLEAQSGAEIRFDFELVYFNSSTAKVLMGLFDTLDAAAESGNDVTVTWIYASDDDNIQELGEEFAEDLEHARFVLKEVDPD